VTADATNGGGTPAGAGITFSSTINGGQALVLTGGTGQVDLHGIVGGGTALTSLTASGSSIHLYNNITASGSTLHFISPVVLENDLTLTDTGSGITFDSTISANPVHNRHLTLSATNGQITASNTIDLAILTATLSGNGSFQTIIATGGVSIASSNGNLAVGAVSTNTGHISLQPSATELSNFLSTGDLMPQGVLSLNGDLSATASNILLSPSGRTALLSVAGIRANQNTLISGVNVTLGQYETLTVFGNISLTGAVSVSVMDLIATGNLAITAPTINVFLHGPGQIYDSFGVLYTSENTNIDASSDKTVTLSVAPTFSGVGLPANIDVVTFNEAAFTPLLSFSGYLLDFDEANLPPPPPPSSSSSSLQPIATERFGIAVSELFFHLPIQWLTLRSQPPLSFSLYEDEMPFYTQVDSRIGSLAKPAP
jgi:hypothetical protein